MKFIKYGLGIVLFISVQSIFAQDISGKWKTVDDKSGFSRADVLIKLTKITKHAKRHFWLNDVCTCHGLLPSHSA